MFSRIQNTYHAFFATQIRNEAVDSNKEIAFRNEVDAWANEYAPGEDRATAAERIKDAYLHTKRDLNLEGLGLTTLPKKIGKLESLSVLRLCENKLMDVSVLSDLVNLSCLELSRNRIADITALASLTKLSTLTLNNNRITDITSLFYLRELTKLNLDKNRIIDVTCLSSLTALLELNLDANRITDIKSLSKLVNLNKLSLSRNRIEDIMSLSDLVNLKSLSLSRNRIEDITSLSDLVNLKSLSLNENYIKDITALSKLTKLLELCLMHNQLTDVTVLSNMTELESLYLGDNQLTDITGLSDLTKLSFLGLEDNQLADVIDFSNMTELKELALVRNQLTSIPDSLLHLSDQCHILLGGNRFSEEVIAQLCSTMKAENYTGPRMFIAKPKIDNLVDMVSTWYQDSESNISSAFSKNRWESIGKEPFARYFSKFLQHLYKVKPYRYEQPVFKAQMLDLLKRMEEDKAFRHEMFLEARNGATPYEPGMISTFTAMKQRELTLNVERGDYDTKLDELVSHARQAFRFNELEKFAYEKGESLIYFDEAYLEYLVGSHKDLSLDFDAAEIHDLPGLYVALDDIQAAVQCIKQNENTQFLNYLTNEWAPWPAVLKRLKPTAYSNLEATTATAKEKVFKDRQAVLTAGTSVANIDHLQLKRYTWMREAPSTASTSAVDVSHLRLIRDVLDEKVVAHKREFTQTFLQRKGLGALLNPVWCVDV